MADGCDGSDAAKWESQTGAAERFVQAIPTEETIAQHANRVSLPVILPAILLSVSLRSPRSGT